jgi:hypothetical protein
MEATGGGPRRWAEWKADGEGPDIFRCDVSGLDEEVVEEMRDGVRELLAALPGGPHELPTPTAN